MLARLEVPTYRARVERAIVMTVEAFDWNCPQHITPRFTEAESADLVSPLRQRLAEITPENESLKATVANAQALGSGPLELAITGMRQLTPRIRAYELRASDGGLLPAWTAGAHLSVPVRLPDGREQTRSYSLMRDPAQHEPRPRWRCGATWRPGSAAACGPTSARMPYRRRWTSARSLADLPPDAMVYVCGPASLIAAVTGSRRRWAFRRIASGPNASRRRRRAKELADHAASGPKRQTLAVAREETCRARPRLSQPPL
ncbi:hypothetical protein KEU06_24340 [Pseudaminobacter sp. 19-2017]|uniref:FAD-binding FR-type domain-containing protein n=1 Tax=Pseudaminobacter soli (ex Zhang et al. 2022) TaxID=2831468 RepID=A0A942E783_9HYPH|nr:hypothetical protein [Pseudaminobacter soli]MBS3651750.1 hypothetical protein [Pseudaminobacter soli]